MDALYLFLLFIAFIIIIVLIFSIIGKNKQIKEEQAKTKDALIEANFFSLKSLLMRVLHDANSPISDIMGLLKKLYSVSSQFVDIETKAKDWEAEIDSYLVDYYEAALLLSQNPAQLIYYSLNEHFFKDIMLQALRRYDTKKINKLYCKVLANYALEATEESLFAREFIRDHIILTLHSKREQEEILNLCQKELQVVLFQVSGLSKASRAGYENVINKEIGELKTIFQLN